MANGDSRNWDRVCAAIDGFRIRHGRWPKRVRVMPESFVNLVSHVLSPPGFALVSSVVELVPEDEAGMIAEDGTGAEYDYGNEDSSDQEADPPAHLWFGEAVLRSDLGW